MSNGLRFGSSGVIRQGCPITCSIGDDAPTFPFFTIGGDSNYFDLGFQPESLREFVRLANQALTTMDALRAARTQPRTKPGATTFRQTSVSLDWSHESPAITYHIKHASWLAIDKGCEITANVSSDEEMFFRFGALGAWSNNFELSFDMEALRTFATLGLEALAKLGTVHPHNDQADPLARQLITVGR